MGNAPENLPGAAAQENVGANQSAAAPAAGHTTDAASAKLPKQSRYHDFAAEHQFSFGWAARQLAPDDPALQDDLVQEMSLAVLQYDKPADFDYLFELAKNRAKNYLKYELKRGMMSLNEARTDSARREAAVDSLDKFIVRLTRNGIPLEWIEEVLGVRLKGA